ncbi:MAG: hypothetical protein AAGF84_09180 [Planctomycetota bacterium]
MRGRPSIIRDLAIGGVLLLLATATSAQPWDVRVAADNGSGFAPIDTLILPDGTRALGYRDQRGRATVTYQTDVGFTQFNEGEGVGGFASFATDPFGQIHFASIAGDVVYGTDFARRDQFALEFDPGETPGNPVSNSAIAVDERGIPTLLRWFNENSGGSFVADTFDPVSTQWQPQRVPSSLQANNNIGVDATYLSDGRQAWLASNGFEWEVLIEDAQAGWNQPFALTGTRSGAPFLSSLTGFGDGGLAFATFNAGKIEVNLFDGVALTTETITESPGPYLLSFDAIADDGADGLGVVFTEPNGSVFLAERVGADDWTVEDLGVAGRFASLAYGASGSPVIGVVANGSNDVLLITQGIFGDYNGNGQVEQGDLNLVLSNWGVDTSPVASGGLGVPVGWVNDRPDGVVDQAELNGVLSHWGTSQAPVMQGFAVPEPGAAALVAAGIVWGSRRMRR